MQCCRMCAALVCAAADAAAESQADDANNIRDGGGDGHGTSGGGATLSDVAFQDADPGRLARCTALQDRGWERQHGR
jgi:hypothetical protein